MTLRSEACRVLPLEKGRSWRTARHTRGHFAWKANRKNARLLEAHLPLGQVGGGLGYFAASSASTSASVNTRLRVRNRKPSGASSVKP